MRALIGGGGVRSDRVKKKKQKTDRSFDRKHFKTQTWPDLSDLSNQDDLVHNAHKHTHTYFKNPPIPTRL